MIDHTLDTEHAILFLHPNGKLEQSDFERIAHEIDPYLEKAGKLRGIVIEAAKFPGWESFAALAAHFRFVRDHHKKIDKIAIVTDSSMANVAEKLGSHFVAAEIKPFPAGQGDAAKRWVLGA